MAFRHLGREAVDERNDDGVEPRITGFDGTRFAALLQASGLHVGWDKLREGLQLCFSDFVGVSSTTVAFAGGIGVGFFEAVSQHRLIEMPTSATTRL